jgi:hypothetical protein
MVEQLCVHIGLIDIIPIPTVFYRHRSPFRLPFRRMNIKVFPGQTRGWTGMYQPSGNMLFRYFNGCPKDLNQVE